MGSFLGGRSDRWEYWTSVVLLTAGGLVFPMVHVRAAAAGLAVMWIVTWVRRLHDTGNSGWIAAFPCLLLLVSILLGFEMGGRDFRDALASDSLQHGLRATPHALDVLVAVLLASLLVQYGFTIWLGWKSGEPCENRFGPPPAPAVPTLEE